MYQEYSENPRFSGRRVESRYRWLFLIGNQRTESRVKKSKRGAPMSHVAEISDLCTECQTSQWVAVPGANLCAVPPNVWKGALRSPPWRGARGAVCGPLSTSTFILKSVPCFGKQATGEGVLPRERRSKGRRGGRPALAGWWKVLGGAASRQLRTADWQSVHRQGLDLALRCICHHWKLETEVQSPKTRLLFTISLESWRKFYWEIVEAKGASPLTSPEPEALAWKLPIRRTVTQSQKDTMWPVNLDVNTRVWQQIQSNPTQNWLMKVRQNRVLVLLGFSHYFH